MGKKIDDKSLIEETYAASLEPARLGEFEQFWEDYIDSRRVGELDHPIEDSFLKSHFSMALGIVERIRHDQDEEDYFHRLVNGHPGFAIVISNEGKIVSGNADAIEITDNASSLMEMGLTDYDINELLTWCEKGSEFGKKDTSLYLFKDVNWGNANMATLMVAPVMPPRSESESSAKDNQYFLISRIDLEVTDSVLPPFKERYGLTDSEAVVVMHLANGLSAKEISALRGTSELTIRTQIKQSLAKTETRGIADLVRLTLSLAAKFNSVISQAKRFEAAQVKDSLTRIYSLILPDGRYMEYAEQGRPNGKPILYFHCITKSIPFTDKCARQAAMKGWRLISPYRAGIGNSDPNIQKTPSETLNSAALDYKFLMENLGIEKAPIVSSWGGHFAQRFANLFPELVSGLLFVSTVPVWHKSHMSYFKSRPRTIVKTAYYAPAAAPYILRVAKALVDGGGGKHFVEKIDEERSDDLVSLHHDKEVLDIMAHGFEEIFKQGTSTFLAELKTIITNWAADSKKLTVPVTVMRGGTIKNKPDSAYGEFANLVPHADVKIIEEAGIYMQYTYFDRLLQELVEFGG